MPLHSNQTPNPAISRGSKQATNNQTNKPKNPRGQFTPFLPTVRTAEMPKLYITHFNGGWGSIACSKELDIVGLKLRRGRVGILTAVVTGWHLALCREGFG